MSYNPGTDIGTVHAKSISADAVHAPLSGKVDQTQAGNYLRSALFEVTEGKFKVSSAFDLTTNATGDIRFELLDQDDVIVVTETLVTGMASNRIYGTFEWWYDGTNYVFMAEYNIAGSDNRALHLGTLTYAPTTPGDGIKVNILAAGINAVLTHHLFAQVT